MLNSYNFSKELLPVEIIDSVLGVTIVVEIDEGKLVFDCDVIDLAIFSKKIFDIVLPGPVADTSEVDATIGHF